MAFSIVNSVLKKIQWAPLFLRFVELLLAFHTDLKLKKNCAFHEEHTVQVIYTKMFHLKKIKDYDFNF